MSLQAKILHLKLNAALAVKHANGWQKLIDLYGEEKALAFYEHLGLNHLPRKSYEYEGLTLSREPKEHEKLAVKGIASAQESAKESIGKILLDIRESLISDGLKGIASLSPADYHTLTLQVDSDFRQSLRDRLISVHKQGRILVSTELGKKSANASSSPVKANKISVDGFDDLDLLTDLTDSRVANDVQSRIIAAAQRFTLLGLTGKALLEAITGEINNGSVSYIDRAATGLANKVINLGRSDEAATRADDWDRVEYSALLDQNVCDPCASFDGSTATDEADLEPAPSPSCHGFDNCRCFHAFISE